LTTRRKILSILPAPNYRSKIIAGWQNTGDIVQAIKKQHAENRFQAAKIKHLFCGANERETARNIFEFLKTNISYRVESAEKQTTKSISRFVSDGFGDCKHYAIFANTILEQCGYKPVYRFAGYRNNKDLQHVYTYLPQTNTVLDAVLTSFDTEKTPTIKKDISMALYKLSGIEKEISGVNFSKIKSNLQKATAKASQTVQKTVKQIPAAAKKVVETTKTVSLAAPRTAFLGLVSMNIRGLASSLSALIAKRGVKDGLSFWETFGGDVSALQKAIANGANKKQIFGVQEENAAFNEIYSGYSGDGVYIGEVVTATTAIATATPIILKITDILKKAGINPDDVKKIAATAKEGTKKFKEITGKNVQDVIFKKDAGANSKKASITADDLKQTDNATAEKIVTAAVAQSTGTDIFTINEIKQTVAETAPMVEPMNNALPEPSGPIRPNILDKPKPALPINLFTNRNLLIGGAALVAAYFIFKKR
jgi:hypothetical protein